MTLTMLDTMAPVAVASRVRAGLGHEYGWTATAAGVCFQHTANATKRSAQRLGRTQT
jgi:hypothetical protein